MFYLKEIEGERMASMLGLGQNQKGGGGLNNGSVGSRQVSLGYIPDDIVKSIYHYFYHVDNWIGICRELEYSMTFQGGITVRTKLGKDLDSMTGSGNSKHDKGLTIELTPLLEKVIDYKKMFGCVPVKVLNDPLSYRGKRAVIPEFGSGTFEKVYDKDTMQVRVAFRESSVSTPIHGGAGGIGGLVNNGGGGGGINNDGSDHSKHNNIHTFVWKNHEPSIEGGLKSKIYKLYKRHLECEEMMTNLLESDYNIAHPTLITQTAHDKRTLDQFTEEDVFADAERGADTQEEQMKYRRDFQRSERMKQQYYDGIGMKLDERAKKKVMDMDTNQITSIVRKTTWQSNRFQIPEGEQLVQQVQPKSRSDVDDFIKHHEEVVCLTMGIPLSYLTQSKSIKAGIDQELDMLQKMVNGNRKALTEFYDFLYNVMYKEEENTIIRELMLMVDHHESSAMMELESQFKQRDDASSGSGGGASSGLTHSNDDSKEPPFTMVKDKKKDGGSVGGGGGTSESVAKKRKKSSSSVEKAINAVAESQGEIDSMMEMKEYHEKTDTLKRFYEGKRAYLTKMITKNTRAKLLFLENPFVSMKPIEDITLCADRKAITEEEEINLMRSKLGIPKLESDDPRMKKLLDDKEKEKKEEKEMMMMKKSPAKPVAAASSSSSKDKPKKKEKEKKKQKK